jgi:NAD(P)-dependent dehydrogenase (short-subunit alcohol dehydrogenase family)
MPKYTNKLENKKVVVIGGSAGIGMHFPHPPKFRVDLIPMNPGYGAAEAALESGANVYIGSSNAERVESAVKSLESDNASGKGSIQGRAIDLKSDESVKEFVDWVAGDTKGGGEQGVDHLIFTAGDALMLGDLMDTNLKEAKAVSLVVAIHLPDLPLIHLDLKAFEVRFWGALRVVKAVHPVMKDRGRFGSITLTSVRPRFGNHTWSVNG